jgi:hypothetical protein
MDRHRRRHTHTQGQTDTRMHARAHTHKHLHAHSMPRILRRTSRSPSRIRVTRAMQCAARTRHAARHLPRMRVAHPHPHRLGT